MKSVSGCAEAVNPSGVRSDRADREREQEGRGDPDREADRERRRASAWRRPGGAGPAATQRPAIGPNSGPTTIAPTIRIGESSRIPTDAIRQASSHEERGSCADSSVFSEVRGSTSSQTTRVARRARCGACSACVGNLGDRESICSIAIEPSVVDVELAQVGDDHAGVLAGDVAEDHVALGLARGSLEEDQVADRRGVRRAGRARARTGGWGRRSAGGPRGLAYRWQPGPPGRETADAHRLSPPPAPRRSRRLAGRATSPSRTSIATSRRLRRPGIDELGVSEHVYRFTRGARDLGPPRAGGSNARDDLDAYCEFVRTHPAAARDRDGLRRRAARTGSRPCSTRTTSTTWSARSTSSATGRSTDEALRRLGGGRRPRRGLARATSRRSRQAARIGPVRHPRPPGPGQGLGRRPARARARPALPLRAGDRGDRRVGIAVEVSTAGLRKPIGELYPSPAFAELCVEAGACFALSSDAHVPADVGLRLRSGGERDAWLGNRSDRGLRAPPAPPGAARREGRHRLRQPPLRGRPAPGARRASRSTHDRGLAGHSRRRRRHPRGDRRPARRRRDSATSGPTSRPRRSAGAMPTRSTCCGPWSGCSPDRSPTST